MRKEKGSETEKHMVEKRCHLWAEKRGAAHRDDVSGRQKVFLISSLNPLSAPEGV